MEEKISIALTFDQWCLIKLSLMHYQIFKEGIVERANMYHPDNVAIAQQIVETCDFLYDYISENSNK